MTENPRFSAEKLPNLKTKLLKHILQKIFSNSSYYSDDDGGAGGG